ncbi:MAG: hypothetical protein LBD42_05450, partial [Desulfovibrio sp.]|nr:hypothetical protein [Desulfovibrio sp.]
MMPVIFDQIVIASPETYLTENAMKVSRSGQNAVKAREDLILNPYPGIAAASRYPRGAPAASLRAFGGA